jgi:hypothetical protein
MTNPKTSRSRPKKPPQRPGERFRASVLDLYVLDPGETALLDRCAALLDIVTRLEDRIAAEDITATGSKGQTVASPLLVVHRSHAKVLAALLDQLALPRLEQEKGQPSPAGRARRAALQRWNRVAG